MAWKKIYPTGWSECDLKEDLGEIAEVPDLATEKFNNLCKVMHILRMLFNIPFLWALFPHL